MAPSTWKHHYRSVLPVNEALFRVWCISVLRAREFYVNSGQKSLEESLRRRLRCRRLRRLRCRLHAQILPFSGPPLIFNERRRMRLESGEFEISRLYCIQAQCIADLYEIAVEIALLLCVFLNLMAGTYTVKQILLQRKDRVNMLASHRQQPQVTFPV